MMVGVDLRGALVVEIVVLDTPLTAKENGTTVDVTVLEVITVDNKYLTIPEVTTVEITILSVITNATSTLIRYFRKVKVQHITMYVLLAGLNFLVEH